MVISQELYIFLVSSSIIGLTLACISSILGGLALCKIIGLEKSTHQVQFVPIDEEINQANEDFTATTAETFDAEQKRYDEQLEDDMPEFVLGEDDKKTFSF